MKLANEVISLLGRQTENSCQAEEDAFQELLQEYGIEDCEVSIVKEGSDYLVSLSDGSDKETFVFGVDEDDDAYCISGDEGDDLGDFADCIDLNSADPTFAADGGLDMTDLSWMNQSVVNALFSEAIAASEVDEKTKIVVRGGKKVKVVVKIRKKRLSAKQKAGLKKAQRKAHTGAAKRKRKLSMKIRKRLGLK